MNLFLLPDNVVDDDELPDMLGDVLSVADDLLNLGDGRVSGLVPELGILLAVGGDMAPAILFGVLLVADDLPSLGDGRGQGCTNLFPDSDPYS